MISTLLVSAAALIGVIGLVFAWVVKFINITKQVNSNDQVRKERLKPIDALDTKIHTEVKADENKIESYEHDYHVKLGDDHNSTDDDAG